MPEQRYNVLVNDECIAKDMSIRQASSSVPILRTATPPICSTLFYSACHGKTSALSLKYVNLVYSSINFD